MKSTQSKIFIGLAAVILLAVGLNYTNCGAHSDSSETSTSSTQNLEDAYSVAKDPSACGGEALHAAKGFHFKILDESSAILVKDDDSTSRLKDPVTSVSCIPSHLCNMCDKQITPTEDGAGNAGVSITCTCTSSSEGGGGTCGVRAVSAK